MSENVNGFHDITLFTDNVAELSEFYQKVGFRKLLDQGDLVVLGVGENELAIHVAPARPSQGVGMSFLVKDLASTREHLAAANIPFEGPKPERPGLSGIKLRDPIGNVISFLAPDP